MAAPFDLVMNMKDFARTFYSSDAWKKCRAAYRLSKAGLCERCIQQGKFNPGVIVHHKVHLTPQNIGDPNVSLNWDNLELLCRDCHAEEHGGGGRRFFVDKNSGKIYVKA